MKIFLLPLITLTMLLLSACSSQSTPSDPTANWLHDYDKALELATKEKKNVYLFVGADKCPFCKKFKDKTLSQSHVIEKLQKDYVLLYLSRDQHFIPEQFERVGVPKHYFLSAKGEVLFASFGLLEPEGFFLLLDEAELNADN